MAMLVMNQGAVAQPVDQFLRVGRTKDVVDGVGFSRLFDSRRNSQQMQVVVAQNGDGTSAKELGNASCRERVCQHVSIWEVEVSLKQKKCQQLGTIRSIN